MKHLKTFAVVLSLALLTLVPRCYSQDVTSSITGVVTDPSGGNVVGAKGVARNLGTNATYHAESNAEGVYWFRQLPVGEYTLEFTLAGFQAYQIKSLRLQVNETARVDIHLVVGSVSSAVTVEAAPVTVDTVTGTLKAVVDQKRIEELPLNGRNPVQLMTLVVGVTSDSGANVTSGTTYGNGSIASGVSANGNRSNSNNYVLDGAQHNDSYSNAPNPFPNPDALQEFSVQTNSYSAEFGRQSGALVNAITKSGTNQLHGSAFEYLRNTYVNAANYFNPNAAGGGKLGDGLKRNQFGFTVGGPVLLPKIYRGTDKTFFFFSYQETLLRQNPFSGKTYVPNAAQRAGDFSALATTLKDPTTGANLVPRNVLPAALISPVSKSILDNYIPLPTNGSYIYTAAPNNLNDSQIMVKIDHNFGDRNRLSGRYFRSRAEALAYLNPKNILESATGGNWYQDSVTASDTHTISPSLINTALFSYNRTDGYFAPLQPSKSLTSLGVKMYAPTAYKYEINIDGYFGINTGDTNSFPREEYQYLDTVRWTKGRHQISFGGDYSRGTGDIYNNWQANGIFNFNGGAPFTKDALADFVTGRMNYLSQGVGQYKNNRYSHVALFVQDSIRATSRLTLDVGMRWEPFLPYTDELNRLAVYHPGQRSTRYPNAPLGVLYAGDPGLPSGTVPSVWTNFGPRVGFAYDVFGNGKTAIRGGYGIFYDYANTIFTNNQATQAPFGTVVTTYGNATNSFADPYAGTTNPFPMDTNPPASVAFLNYSQQTVFDAHFRNPYVQSWNFTVEQALPKKFILRGSYAGSKGTRLYVGNQLNPAVYTDGATTATTNQRRIYAPTLGSTTLMQSVGNSTFNAMQWTIERRFANGFTIMANYQYSKSLDDSSASKGTAITRTNPFNQSFDKGPSDYNRPHVTHISGLYTLPFRFQNHLSETLLGGWNLNGILNITSGVPFNVGSGVDNARTGMGGQRADLTGTSPFFTGDRSFNERIAQYLNKSAFQANAIGTYGVLGRNVFYGPGSHNLDLGLYKDFKVHERYVTTLRFEVFNALNTVNLGQPSTSTNSATFMQITSAGNPRILQGALRFKW